MRDEEASEGEVGAHLLPQSRVIALPKGASCAILPPGAAVLAVYPGTTTFYRATVVRARALLLCARLPVCVRVLRRCRQASPPFRAPRESAPVSVTERIWEAVPNTPYWCVTRAPCHIASTPLHLHC